MAIEYPWTEAPAFGTAIEVAPGVAWLRMPLPFQLNHINLWLLEDGPGWAIVDTGVGLPDVRALWEQVFGGYLGGRPVTQVIVTHFHPDHMGNTGWLTQRFGVDLWCPQAEFLISQVAHRTGELGEHHPRMEHYRRNGCTEEQLIALAGRGDHYIRLVPTLPPTFRLVADGDSLMIGGRRWTMIVGHGHSPEHAAFWCREAGVLISGDQVLPKITSNVSVWPDQPHGNPLRRYLASLEHFRDIAADALILPAHGLPFRGLPERLVEVRTHHDARLANTLDAITEARSAAEVVPVLFRRKLDSHQLSFALGEALAHLHYLEAEGRAVRVMDAAGVYRFKKV